MFSRRAGFRGAWLAAAFAVASLCEYDPARADDWPTYGRDPSRSAVTEESLSFPLTARWVYRASQPPAPAWPEPGKELHRMDFDYAPQPVVSNGLVYFASSADDTVRAHEAASGAPAWRFTAGAPVRFAPSVAAGRLYAAADDGWVYCLDAKTGNRLWQFRAAPADDQLIGNGRMISRWPCRSGAVVQDGVVYCTAGMWPSEGVFVYALEAETGRVLWSNDTSGDVYLHVPHPGATSFSGVAPQGYLLVWGDTLLVATGRCVPAAFDRRTGRLLYYKPADALKDGGAWLTAADGLYFNPKNRFQNPSQAFVGEAPPSAADGMIAYSFTSGDPEFTLVGAYRVLAARGMLYTVTNENIQAVDLNRRRKALPAGKVGPGKPSGAESAKGREWTAPYAAPVYALAVAGGALLAGTSGGIDALDAASGELLWSEKVDGQVRGLAVASGRLVAATNRGDLFCFEHGAAPRAEIRDDAPPAPDALPEEHRRLAQDALQRSGTSEGYALVIGEPDSRLAEALAVAARKLHVVCVLPTSAAVASEREHLLQTGLYGGRVSVHHSSDLSRLPFGPYFADLVVVSGKVKGVAPAECYRMLRPCGGVMCFAGLSRAQRQSFVEAAGVSTQPGGEWAEPRGTIVRGPLPGSGEWRYPWADGGRSGVGAESLVRLPLRVLWFGGPGPNRLMDRHWMGSPPLAVAGRVFLSGQDDVLAFDAYNGRELWSRPLEGAGRRYSQYYSENFVADDRSVYLAIRDRCYRLDQATGATTFVYRIPDAVVRQTPPPVVDEYIDVPWPDQWLVLGPFAGGKLPLSGDDLRSIPDRITFRGEAYAARPLAASGGVLDLKKLDRAAGANKPPLLAETVYAFAKIRCPKAGKLLIRAGADGTMQWYVDGQRVFDSTQDQGLAPRVVGMQYLFDADVTAGEHVVAAVARLTGEPRTARDFLTGEEIPWSFRRAYGCGPVSGCQNLLFFRSGADGMVDMATRATANFGGIRPGCSRSLTAAGGLLIHPEGYSGCACSYNFQTSLAMIAAPESTDFWYLLPRGARSGPIRRLAVNFGAPGDRCDRSGTPWLGFPRPVSGDAVEAPVSLLMENASRYYHRGAAAGIEGDAPWVYSSGLRGRGQIAIDMALEPNLIIPACRAAPAVDGRLDDPCWKEAAPAAFEYSPFTMLAASVELRIVQDAENLYFGYHRKPLSDARSDVDAETLRRSDDFQIYLTDRAEQLGLHFALARSGETFAHLTTVNRSPKVDPNWRGRWQGAVRELDGQWTAEAAVPLELLARAGIDRRQLEINCMSRNLTRSGLEAVFLIDPGHGAEFHRCTRFRTVGESARRPPPPRSFTVRLHFAELDEGFSASPSTAARPVFDVAIQGKTVLEDLDVVREAGGTNRPLVREFHGIQAGPRITIELLPNVEPGTPAPEPLISGVEVFEEGA